MEDRTINIIAITKHFWNLDIIKRAIAQYMSEECECPVSFYTDEIIFGIVRTAALDFIFHAERKRDSVAFVSELLNNSITQDLFERIIVAMTQIQVCTTKNGNYVYLHGWHETDFTKRLDNNEWV